MRSRVLIALVVLALLLAGPALTTANAQTTDQVTLTISVVNQNSDPVGNAELTATWENGSTTETTASNGKAFVDVPSGANVTVSVSHPEYIRNHPFVVRNVSDQDVRIPVFRQGQLSVVVADDSGPVADARVVLRNDGRITTQDRTNDEGVFESGDIERGEYTVAVVKPGYRRNGTTVQVEASTRTRVAIERGTVLLTVAVRDSHFSPPRPVSNATVRIESIGRFQTLAGGETSVSVPVNTELSVVVSKAGYEDVTTRVRVDEADLRTNVSTVRTPSLRLESLNQRVVAGERLGVEVVDEYSDPVEDASVLLDGDSVGSTDADGRVTVTVERPGNHTLVATKGGLRSSPATVRAIVEEGETATRTETPTATQTGSESDTPGFTSLAAVFAIAVVLVTLTLRRR